MRQSTINYKLVRETVAKRIGFFLEISSQEFSFREEHNIWMMGKDDLPEFSNCRRLA
jgi:hypothetical protein